MVYCHLQMKFMIRASFPTAEGNEMVKNPNFIKDMEEYIKNTNAESAYFTPYEGERTAIFIIDVTAPDQIPKIAEPLFALGGKVYWNNLMTIDDLKKGLS